MCNNAYVGGILWKKAQLPRVVEMTFEFLKECFGIYNLTNYCTVILNKIITNNMLLHVSTFKMSSSRRSLRIAKITYRFY